MAMEAQGYITKIILPPIPFHTHSKLVSFSLANSVINNSSFSLSLRVMCKGDYNSFHSFVLSNHEVSDASKRYGVAVVCESDLVSWLSRLALESLPLVFFSPPPNPLPTAQTPPSPTVLPHPPSPTHLPL